MSAGTEHLSSVDDDQGYGDVDEDLDGAGRPVEDETTPPLCEDVATWVELIYAPTFPRRLNSSVRWCPQWWRHAEAIVRLTALWRSWEAARASEEAAAMADWLRGYLDPLNPVLLSPDGPFAACTPSRHSDSEPLPLQTPPVDWFTGAELDPSDQE